MLDINNVSFAYGTKKVLDDVSFSIEKGQIVGLLGANGAGKSTLFKLLNSSVKSSAGQVLFDGKSVADYAPAKLARRMALVPQNPTASFGFTVEDIIAMGRRPFQTLFSGETSNDRDIINAVIEETGLSEFRERVITSLSGGERQMAFLARAFVQEPELLLLDEATSNLDINHTLSIFRLVKERVKRDNLTVVAIIHDINLAALFCDRIVYLSDGQAVGPGSPLEMISSEHLSSVYSLHDFDMTVNADPLYVSYHI